MTLLDHLARLESLAAAATPGPWRESPSGGFVLSGTDVVCSLVNCDGPVSANREFIAALDPDTVRALIAVAKAAQEYVDGGSFVDLRAKLGEMGKGEGK